MKRPPYGLSFPCTLAAVRDGDTQEYDGTFFLWAIRSIDCWCRETNRGSLADRKLGKEAGAAAARFLETNKENLSIWIPPPDKLIVYWRKMDLGEPPRKLNPFKLNTFDRIPGHVFIADEMTLAEALIKHGYATEENPK